MGNLKNYISVLESGSREKGGAIADGIPSLGAEHLNNSGGFNLSGNKLKYISKEHFYSMKTGKINKKDILVVKDGATTGKTSYVDENFPFDEAAINEHVFLLRTKENLSPKYLFYYLYSDTGKEHVLNDYRGATVGGISRNFIDMPIPIPSLPVQQQIADVLNRASALIEKRKAQIEKLDLLIKSQFIEMFGDPVINPKGWETKTFANVSKVRQGLQIPISKRKSVAGHNRFKYITVQYLNGNKEEEYIENPRPNVICYEDNILMTRTGNTGLVISGVHGVFHNNFFLIDFNQSVLEKTFLICYLNTQEIQHELLRRAGTSTIPDLNHSDFYKIAVYLPPLSLQAQFATFVHLVEAQKSLLQQSLANLELNYKSLMQKCFRGEIF